jgi:hypothetical protein
MTTGVHIASVRNVANRLRDAAANKIKAAS